MIKKFEDYDTIQGYSDFPTLPKGGYVCRIMGVKVENSSNGSYLKLGIDIAEGEYKDFYTNQYKNDSRENKKWGCNFLVNIPKDDGSEKDGWTKRSFKTFITAVEDSNSGYHWGWDEETLKNRLVGGLFNEREYQKNDGTIGRSTNMAKVCAVEKIKSGDYKLPEDKLIKKFGDNSSDNAGAFISVPEGIIEELPFN